MKNRVLLKSALLLLLIAANGLVTASEDDDLIFDPESKQTAAQAPLIETHQDHSLFHRIKRGVWEFFTSPSTTTTTTTQAPSDQKEEDGEDQNQDIDKSVILNVGDAGNLTLDQPEALSAESIGGIERLTLEKNENIDEADDEHENEISNAAESQRKPIIYGNSDDEDLAGSGEIEGSAGEEDYHPNTENQHHNTDAKARFYRTTLTVGEPYRREYSDRNSPEYRELSGNLTHAIENLYNRHIPGYNHFASVVKISPTTDAFTSQVTLDIGSTFTDEVEVRAILEQQLQYHSLGSIQVGPEGFTFRIFQAGEKDPQPECDQTTELRCRSGECVPLESRCDGILQCNDGSDEDNCPTDSLNKTNDDFEHTTVTSQHPTRYPSQHSLTASSDTELKSEVSESDIDDSKNEDSTLRSSSNKCRADDTVRCEDGSRYICSVQQCDGIQDCDDGGDEVDCPHPGCSAGEFACDVNRCILESQRCNFVEDCQDGSDEHDCRYPACSSTEFVCRNGQCVDSNKFCNGVLDCYDGSDEHNCPCKEDQFECAPGYCVPLSRRCDGYTDCVGGRDEQNCYNMTRCRASEFECASGSCVSKNARCDGRNDCLDHSDEYNCNVTTCSGDQFRCLDGICLSIDKRCNGITDCRNGEDENQCECPPGQLPCDNGVCINKNFFCDRNVDCHDASDERNCPDGGETGGSVQECHHDSFTCNDGSCIPQAAVCDGRADCPHDEDETNCRRGCTRDQFQCANGDCIRADQRCNGYIECADGSDEPEECESPEPSPSGQCAADQYMCVSDRRCVPLSSICNGIPECRDGSDERNCDRGAVCSHEEWTCKSGDCIPQHQRCDRLIDCPYDDSDELDCHHRTMQRNHSRCGAHEWTCNDGHCIPLHQRCDKRLDCPRDMSDEMDCSYDNCESPL